MGKDKTGIIRVPCDGLATQEGGWVEVCAYLMVKHLPYVWAIDERGFDKKQEELPNSERGKAVLALRCDLMVTFVIDWNWKDPKGNPYPKPAGNVEAFQSLRPPEFNWLWETVWATIREGMEIPKANDTPS